MKKKTQSERQSEQRDTSAEPKTFRLDRSDLRYVFCSLALLILLAWALMNFGSVVSVVGRIGTLFFSVPAWRRDGFLNEYPPAAAGSAMGQAAAWKGRAAEATDLSEPERRHRSGTSVRRSVYHDSESARIRK